MAMGSFTIFAKNLDKTELTTLIGETVKVALVDSGYTPNSTATGHSIWADISGDEIAGSGGYSTGGFLRVTG